jgi:hypothetical protein
MSVLVNQLSCPECGQFTNVIDHFTLGSTDGPVEHVRMLCPDRHVYFGPMARIVGTVKLVHIPDLERTAVTVSERTAVSVPERTAVPV